VNTKGYGKAEECVVGKAKTKAGIRSSYAENSITEFS